MNTNPVQDWTPHPEFPASKIRYLTSDKDVLSEMNRIYPFAKNDVAALARTVTPSAPRGVLWCLPVSIGGGKQRTACFLYFLKTASLPIEESGFALFEVMNERSEAGIVEAGLIMSMATQSLQVDQPEGGQQ